MRGEIIIGQSSPVFNNIHFYNLAWHEHTLESMANEISVVVVYMNELNEWLNKCMQCYHINSKGVNLSISFPFYIFNYMVKCYNEERAFYCVKLLSSWIHSYSSCYYYYSSFSGSSVPAYCLQSVCSYPLPVLH